MSKVRAKHREVLGRVFLGDFGVFDTALYDICFEICGVVATGQRRARGTITPTSHLRMPSGDWALWLFFSTICTTGTTNKPNSDAFPSNLTYSSRCLLHRCGCNATLGLLIRTNHARGLRHPPPSHLSPPALGFSGLWLHVATICLIGLVK